jgi:PadR family transcriptional regulator, regulatory protein PadR
MHRMTAAAERESLLLRGTLDMCLLALLEREPSHAYGVVERLQEHGFAQTSYGTIYPLVSRLRRQGLLTQQTVPSTGGPARNVLTVTTEGQQTLTDWLAQWNDVTDRIQALMKGVR